MILESFVLSTAVGFVRKGSLRNLSGIPLRHFYLFVLPFVLFASVLAAGPARGTLSILPYVKVISIAQYVILLAAIALNVHIREMWVVGAGTFLNFASLAANGGVMPVGTTALRIAGLTQLLNSESARHVIMTPETRLKWLADIIPVPTFSPLLSQVISIGDLVIAVGIFLLVQRYMCRPATDVKERTASG